jgi:hypothetical protein
MSFEWKGDLDKLSDRFNQTPAAGWFRPIDTISAVTFDARQADSEACAVAETSSLSGT